MHAGLPHNTPAVMLATVGKQQRMALQPPTIARSCMHNTMPQYTPSKRNLVRVQLARDGADGGRVFQVTCLVRVGELEREFAVAGRRGGVIVASIGGRHNAPDASFAGYIQVT